MPVGSACSASFAMAKVYQQLVKLTFPRGLHLFKVAYSLNTHFYPLN